MENEREAKQKAIAETTQKFNRFCGAVYLVGLFYAFGIIVTLQASQRRPPEARPANSTPLGKFSEGRAMEHVLRLSKDIGYRQEGTTGLLEAGDYLRQQIQKLKAKASSDISFEVEDSVASGSFHLHFLQRSMTMAYQNVTNIAVRIAQADASDPERAAVLVNGHYDSSLGSQGAADCASCVATMLETLRQVIDSKWPLPCPLIFLFNSGEETFSKAAHGFFANSKWSPSIGALINLEATGAALPDMVVQTGAEAWPMEAYAAAAVHPMATVVAQDVFPLVPGDTDFRIWAHDFDDVPGIDIVYILNAYVYHTPLDSPENLQKGALQARGDNLLPLISAFGASPQLKTRLQRTNSKWSESIDATPIYFDLFGKYMVYYPRAIGVGLHVALFGAVLLAPALFSAGASGSRTTSERYDAFIMGMLTYVASFFLAVALPVILAVTRVYASKRSMNWFANPLFIPAMFVPSAVAGLLVPYILRAGGSYTKGSSSAMTEERRAALEWSGHWGGTVFVNALVCIGITARGGGSGYFFFWWAMFALPALSLFRAGQKLFGNDSPLALLGYFVPMALPAAYSVYFGMVFLQFICEKMGSAGTLPLPFGPLVPDIIMAVLCGGFTALSVAPLVPVLRRWLAHPWVVRALLYASILASVLCCRHFPYSAGAPKRLVLQRLYWTRGESVLESSQFHFATGDANDVEFVLRAVPRLSRQLRLDPAGPLLSDRLYPVHRNGSLAWYPVSDLMFRSLASPAPVWDNAQKGVAFPTLRTLRHEKLPPAEHELDARRRVLLELDTGSLSNVWASVFNFTGPLTGWSLADGSLSRPERVNGGPPSYMVHFAGGNGKSRWRFWIEAFGDLPVHAELAVLDHEVDGDTKSLTSLLPDWIACIAHSSYLSTYIL